MKDRLVITLTDVNGSKHYNFHQIVKKVLLYTILGAVAIFVLGALSIKFLLYELEEIEEKRDAIEREYQLMASKNQDLSNDIKMKTEELIIISDKVEDLEGIVGVENGGSEMRLSLAERVDLASITGAQKRIVLQLIPNGKPLDDIYVTSKYGQRYHPVLKRKETHPGIDLRAKSGTPVYATADGVIDFVSKGYGGGYGNMVKVDHAFGFKTIYGHLSKLAVSKGEFVKKGDIIAYSGNTGLSSGPHLHYEIRFTGRHMNPKPFIEWNFRNYTAIFEKEKQVQWQSLLTTVNRLMEIQAPLSSPQGQKFMGK